MTDITAADSDWDRQLADGFAVLLGRPLEAFDAGAVYAAEVDGNLLAETGFRQEPAWVRPAALRGEESVPGLWVYDAGRELPRFDAARSLFDFPAGAPGRDALPPAFLAAVGAACFRPSLIRGADLAPLVEEHGVDLADPACRGAWSVYFARLVSDGTLFGALVAALQTGRGPAELLEFEFEPEEEVEESWREGLAGVAHPELRHHLGFFCTEGESGLMPVDCGSTGHRLDGDGCAGVMGWEDGYGQLEVNVVRLSEQVAGPHR
ncbi:hypothetical protein ABZ747_05600 [Kitasatospora cineracea]|uniref:hypothetical protein n=1 Tax=Kitasatospora cineracea TaxID=88074 RepID=UPI003410138F